MKRFAIALFVSVAAASAAVVLFTTAAIAIALRWPAAVINDTTLRVAARHAAALGVRIDWASVAVSVDSHGALDKTIGLSFAKPCVEYRPYLERACFEDAEFSVRARMESWRPRLLAIGPVSLDGGEVVVRTSDEDEDGREGADLVPSVALPGWLSGVKFGEARISGLEFEIGPANSSTRGVVDATAAIDDEGEISSVSAEGSVSLPSGGGSLAIRAKAESATRFRGGDWELEADVEASLASDSRAKTQARFSSDGKDRMEHSLTIAYSQAGISADISSEGVTRDEGIDARFSGALKGLSGSVPGFSFRGCGLSLERRDVRKNRGSLSLDCPLEMKLKRMKLPEEIALFYSIPESVGLRLSASAEVPFIPDPSGKIEGQLTGMLSPMKGGIVKTTGEGSANFSGSLSTPIQGWKSDSRAVIHFTVDEFSRLTAMLSKSRWPVPAPFNALDGKIDLAIDGNYSSRTGRGELPAKLSLNLDSKRQRIHATSDGKFTFSVSEAGLGDMELDLSLDLTDVQLELPELGLASLPRLTMDDRIVVDSRGGSKPAEKGEDLDWTIRVETPKGRPARILSNITPTHIPVSVDLLVKPEGTLGTIEVSDFPVELFRRKAKIDRFSMDLKEPSERSEVSGSFSIPYDHYTVTILVAGTVEDPAITLQSTPPLSQADIISTLLYGEPVDALDSGGAASVSSLSAAIADRALALASMFVLASTPIQSVSYNPQTKSFSARIRLGKTTSIVASGGGGTQQVGIRQRIGKGWSVTTTYGTTNDPSTISGATALIEWTKRY